MGRKMTLYNDNDNDTLSLIMDELNQQD